MKTLLTLTLSMAVACTLPAQTAGNKGGDERNIDHTFLDPVAAGTTTPPKFMRSFYEEDGSISTAAGDDSDPIFWADFVAMLAAALPDDDTTNVTLAFANTDASTDGSTEQVTLTDSDGNTVTGTITFPPSGGAGTTNVSITFTNPDGSTDGSTELITLTDSDGNTVTGTITFPLDGKRTWVDDAGVHFKNTIDHDESDFAGRSGRVRIALSAPSADDAKHLLQVENNVPISQAVRVFGGIGHNMDATGATYHQKWSTGSTAGVVNNTYRINMDSPNQSMHISTGSVESSGNANGGAFLALSGRTASTSANGGNSANAAHGPGSAGLISAGTGDIFFSRGQFGNYASGTVDMILRQGYLYLGETGGAGGLQTIGTGGGSQYAGLFVDAGELYSHDQAGNVTLISPHTGELLDDLGVFDDVDRQMGVFHSFNRLTNKGVYFANSDPSKRVSYDTKTGIAVLAVRGQNGWTKSKQTQKKFLIQEPYKPDEAVKEEPIK